MASIHILDDDSLLNVFYFYRHLDDDGDGENAIFLVGEDWERDCYRLRWWYQLAHVCRRWRSLILASSSYLSLSLVCTYGTPVADMLAHSPPLPLVINFNIDRNLTAKDEEAMIFALKQRDRIRRVRVQALDVQKFAMAMERRISDHGMPDYGTVDRG